ncbi:hypothetical protein [Aneurinibacillus uraniidurans]|uniref:hypothetical protein n=1 Tax=Aneurinibacillus uraniidurans TaxID=2966586 RepID=UPI0023492B3C|nr:hypothetical protein [Aneurinibacillus sp. B1]WCN39354.1 hypothetical protein PO771_08160 [Aneurinibacillus sp. B1]
MFTKMVKLRFLFWVIAFMLMFLVGCTSTESSQKPVENSKVLVDHPEKSKESPKATNESWITSELPTYKFQVPSSSKTLTQKYVKEIESNMQAGFLIGEAMLLVGEYKEGTQFFDAYNTGALEQKINLLDKEHKLAVAKNQKELNTAIQTAKADKWILYKNKNTKFFVQDQGTLRQLFVVYLRDNSMVIMLFAVEKKEFNKNVPLFLKITDTISFKK